MNNTNSNNSRNPNSTRNTPRNTRQTRNDDFIEDNYYDQDEPQANSRQRNRQEQRANYSDDDYNNYPQQRSSRRPDNSRQKNRDEYAPNSRQRQDYYDDYSDQRRPNKSNKTLLLSLGAVAIIAIGAGAIFLLTKNSNAQIIAVSPNYITTQQPYQDCHRVGTTTYVANQKNGTEGALIGGATGAVAGGVIGNQVHGGGGGTAVGAIAGGVGGALIGREIQRSNQPDYVARHGSSNQCSTAYKPVQTQVGYSVQYMYKDEMNNIVTQMSPAIGSTMPLEELQAMAVPAAQLNPNANK